MLGCGILWLGGFRYRLGNGVAMDLADQMVDGTATETNCPRCQGVVTVPARVKFQLTNYIPAAQCHKCKTRYFWDTQKMGWYLQNIELDAPIPTIERI